jgi:hypothetical protein
VRGTVASPRITLPNGGPGVDPRWWECSVYALVPNAGRRAVDRIGIARERAPSTPRGDFEIDLPTGSHLVLVQHRIARPGAPPLLEAWYAYAEVGAEDLALRDLGVHTFAPAAVTGVVIGAKGEARAGVRVDFSNESKAPGDPLPRGVHLLASAGDDGRFAISLARADGQEVVGRVSAFEDGASAHRDGARLGDFVELRLGRSEPEAEVVFEIPWSASTRVWIYALDRRFGISRLLGRGTPGETVEERRFLAPGAYAVEIFRPAGPERGEWARVEVGIPDAAPRRIRLNPVFSAARTITGRTKPGSTVAWATRLRDGSIIERDSAAADRDGRFVLRGVPTTQTMLVTGSTLTPVPPGCEAVLDVGELTTG